MRLPSSMEELHVMLGFPPDWVPPTSPRRPRRRLRLRPSDLRRWQLCGQGEQHSALLPQQQLFLLPSLPPPSFSPQAWSASCFATESASMVS